MTRVRRALGILSLVLAAGCASPLLPYSEDRPAQVLTSLPQAGISDGRPRFREIFREVLASPGELGANVSEKEYLHRLPDEREPPERAPGPGVPAEDLRVLIVPGFLNDCAPGGMLTFGRAVPRLRERGYRIAYIGVSGYGGCDHNAEQIAAALRTVEKGPGERLVLLGYSKGAADILHFLANHPEEAASVDAVVSVAGAVNGSPLADGVPGFLPRALMNLSGGDAGDGQGLTSLKRTVQFPWLCRNPPPSRIRTFSVVAFADRENISRALRAGYDALAEIDPQNDSQLLFTDQVIPGSTLLAYANCDHWAVALPCSEDCPALAATLLTRNEYPRGALLEAILLYLREALAAPVRISRGRPLRSASCGRG